MDIRMPGDLRTHAWAIAVHQVKDLPRCFSTASENGLLWIELHLSLI